ncbi:hypothetical protein [uncultured Thiodictyon sp.]|uniref:hypothetical protein n=1 Tax=uncultured Thiodictyon sp. TaxID=1846217 RepID=UPI0025DF9A43|nr:hypothetical protein [uncultured Thiodictyon sp.]
MNTLKPSSEKEIAYEAYASRQDFLRQQSCIERERRSIQQAFVEQSAAFEAQRQALEAIQAERRVIQAERQAIELERQATKAALAEVERLKALPKDVNPPAGS